MKHQTTLILHAIKYNSKAENKKRSIFSPKRTFSKPVTFIATLEKIARNPIIVITNIKMSFPCAYTVLNKTTLTKQLLNFINNYNILKTQ